MKVKIYGLYLFLIISLFVFSPAANAQNVQNQLPQEDLPNPFLIYQKGLQENNYLTPLMELQRSEAEYMKSPQWKGLLPDLLGYLNSFVGRYDTAYAFLDKHFEEQVKPQPDLQSSPIDNYLQMDALQTIVSLADKHQVLMINEEHDTPLHRAFTARLLPQLYKKGFRYLAAETLGEDSAALAKRGYPTHKTGFYSVDPVFGDMLRTALKLGFKLVWYEHQERCVPTAEKPNFCQDKRERGQAQNLYDRIFKDDPNAKVLVHVGRGHNQKLKFNDWAMMAWHFRQISKIEPFSINQMLSERSQPKYERPEYRYVTSKRKFTEPAVFQSKTGEWWNNNGYDLVVYHPRTRYENGRPVWLKMDGRRKAKTVNLKRLKLISGNKVFTGSESVLIQAFYAGEGADTVPVDQIILYPNKEIPALILPKGKYRIRAVDKTGKIAGQYEIEQK